MKLLIFSPYYPPHTGGLESHSQEFNIALSSKGVSLTVFTPLLPDGSPLDESPRPGIRVIRYPAFEIVSNFPAPKIWQSIFWKQLKTLSQEDFDFVISRTRFFISSLLALTFAKYRGLPLIHIEHGSDFVQLSSWFKTLAAKIYDLTFGRLILRSSKINISISEAVQKFVARFDSRPSPVIYRGINFPAIDSAPADEILRQQYSGKIILSTVARLYHWKGIAISIEAIRKLPDNIRSKIVFFIVGDGEDFERLQELSAGLPIVMLGRRKNEEAIGILKITDIYLHSSFPGGGLSTSLLEAMYCSAAVIATPNEGADEVISHNTNGVLLSSPASMEMRQAIEKLIENQTEREKFSEKAREDIQKQFSWDSAGGKYLALLRTIKKA